MTTDIKERLRTLSFAMGKIGADSLERLYEEAASHIEQLEGQLSAQTAVKTEQPSLSDAGEVWGIWYDNLGIEPYDSKFVRGVQLITYDTEEEARKYCKSKHYSPRKIFFSAQRQDSDKDAERFRWIEENCHTEGGGKGFTIFVPVDHEDIGCGIDIAIANGVPVDKG